MNRRHLLGGGPLRASLLAAGLALLAALWLASSGRLGPGARRWILREKQRLLFNRVYSLDDPPFRQEPNFFLTQVAPLLPKGEALDIAAGQGRNALYLAQLGWKVTAFDISDKGLAIARQAAEKEGLGLTVNLASAEEFDYGHERWHLVLLMYAPIPYDDRALMRRICDSVKPGGFVIVETPIEMHQLPEVTPRVPGDLMPGELPDLFQGFEILVYSETLERGDFSPEKTLVGRLLARKPGPELETEPAARAHRTRVVSK